MVDVTGKAVTTRRAVAQAFVRLTGAHLSAMENHPKGDVIFVAHLAGIQAAKRTSELIPLCHTIPLSHVSLKLTREESGIRVTAEATAEAKTGVEMEAITAATVAALTLYDMLKAAGPDIIIEQICLLEKTGGKNDYKR